MSEQRNRDIGLDFAKGLGIFLVVLGHAAIVDIPKEAVWCDRMVSYIYTFHMPLFMAIRGFTVSRYTKKIHNFAEYRQYITKSFLRLMIPHIVFAGIVYSIKCVIGDVGGNPNHMKNILQIYLDPMRSHVVFLWFIYLAFLFCFITPLLQHVTKKTGLLVFVAVMAGYVWSLIFVTRPPALSLLILCAHFLPYYLAGYTLRKWDNSCESRVIFGHALSSIFVVASLWYLFVADMAFIKNNNSVRNSMAWISIGLLAWFLQRDWSGDGKGYLMRYFVAIGCFSFPIYLMNTTIIGGSRMLLVKAGISWNADMLPLHLLIAITFAIGISICVQKYFVENVPILRSLFKR